MKDPPQLPLSHPSLARSVSYFVQRWILRRRFLLARCPALDLRFKVKTEDVVGRHIYKYETHEPESSAFLVEQLRLEPGDVILDVGANIGWYSLLLDRLAPDGVSIFAFEPDPLNFELLQHNIAINGATSITPFQFAVAAEPGTQQLYRYTKTNLGRHSLLPQGGAEPLAVGATSLDAFWDEQGLGSRVPRLIKMDVEGYELPALRGAGSVLRRCPALLGEYSPEMMQRGGLDPAELVALLTGHGFRPNAIGPEGLEPVSEDSLPGLDGTIDLFWKKSSPAQGSDRP